MKPRATIEGARMQHRARSRRCTASMRPLAFALALAPSLGCRGSSESSEVPARDVEPTAAAAEASHAVAPIPEGYHAIIPQLAVSDVEAALAFAEEAFAARRVFVLRDGHGKAVHASMMIGDNHVMLDLETPTLPSPQTLGGTPAKLMLYVPDAEATFDAAVRAGAKAAMPVAEQFWGDRYGELIDPSGHRWAVATHVETLTEAQLERRSAIAMAPSATPPGEGEPPAWKRVEGTPANGHKPAGHHDVTLSLTMEDAASAIDFYLSALGATERMRLPGADGKLVHAEVQLRDSILMLNDANPQAGTMSPRALGRTPIILHHYVSDADAAFARAKASGADEVLPVTKMFWGDRYGLVLDPAGHVWGLASRVEDVSHAEVQARRAAMDGGEVGP